MAVVQNMKRIYFFTVLCSRQYGSVQSLQLGFKKEIIGGYRPTTAMENPVCSNHRQTTV
jgi:hypothetical protein